MKKLNLLKWGFLCLFSALVYVASAQTTITWALGDDDGTDEYEPAYTPSSITGISSCTVTLGATLGWGGSAKSWSNDNWDNLAFSEVKASEAISSESDDSSVDFKITLESGYTFTPTSVSFNAERDGHSKGQLNV
ncbi:MAG: hypothetical protein LUD48_05865, partial [Prevotella sp.]|nr:hypothetical protein [Prevotella sp.]